jgi:hypothetical protein
LESSLSPFYQLGRMGCKCKLKIQSDLNRIVDCCGANSLELKVGKWKLITFSRLRHPVEFLYMLGLLSLIVLSITDLVVVMVSRMSFSLYIDVTVGKALEMLRFVKRMSDEFR